MRVTSRIISRSVFRWKTMNTTAPLLGTCLCFYSFECIPKDKLARLVPRGRALQTELCPWLFIAQPGENSYLRVLQPSSATAFWMSAIDHLWQVFNSLSHQGQCATFCQNRGVLFQFEAANNSCFCIFFFWPCRKFLFHIESPTLSSTSSEKNACYIGFHVNPYQLYDTCDSSYHTNVLSCVLLGSNKQNYTFVLANRIKY